MFFDFEIEFHQTERIRNLQKSVKTSDHYLSIINWSLNNIFHNILWTLAQFSQSQKIVKFLKFGLLVFWIVIVRNMWQKFQHHFRIKNAHPTYCHYPRHSTVSQSCAISSQRPRCANLASREPTHMRLSRTERLNNFLMKNSIRMKFMILG